MFLWCSLKLVLIALAVSPIYIFPHSLGIRYTPGTLIYNLSSADLNICAGFLLDMRVFLILCFFRIQLILLLMSWWDVIMALPVGFLFFFRLQFQYLPQGLSDITVFPFCLMTCLSFCSYPRPQGLLLHIACEPVGLAWLVERLCELGGAQAWRGWEVHSCNIPIYRVPYCAIQISGYQDVQKEQGCVLVPLLREIDVLVDTI